MDRREFFQSMILTPLFMPMVLASKKTDADAELFLISDVPHQTLPPLLRELRALGIVSGGTYSLSASFPRFEDLSRELVGSGWNIAPSSGFSAHLAVSCSQLHSTVRPSFTLARKGRVLDIRTRKILSLWEDLNRSHNPSSLLTIASFKRQPPALETGKTVSLYKDGRRVRNLPLDMDATKSFKTQNGRITVSVAQRKAWIAESSCRHKICIHCPPVSLPGERIICAPNRFLLEVDGPTEVDAIIG